MTLVAGAVKGVKPGAPFVEVEVEVEVEVVVVVVVEEEEEEEEEERMVYNISSKVAGRSNFSLSNTLMNDGLTKGLGEVK